MAKNKYTARPFLPMSSTVPTTTEEAVQEVVEDPSDLESPPGDVPADTAPARESVSEAVLEAAVVVAQEPAAVEVVKQQQIVVESVTPVKAPIVANINEEGKLDMNVQHQLETYADNMAVGKPVDPKAGGLQQYTLYKLIKNILDTENQSEFTSKWNTLINFVNANKTKVFSENYAYRFPEQWPGSDSEYTNFRRVMAVIIATSDNTTRQAALQTLNMEKALEGLTEKQKNKIIIFYNV